MIQGSYYSGRMRNDEHKATLFLDLFTKEFCIDAEKNDKDGDLRFRCTECPFSCEDNTCSVKEFKRKFDPEYVDFGSMGDL